MTEGGFRWLAWTLWAIAMTLALGALVFLILSWSTPTPEGQFGFRGFAMIFAVAFGTPGALIAARHRRNPIGWIFLAAAIVSGFQELANQYAIYAVLHRPGELPLGEAAAWIPAWIWIPGTSAALFLLLLIPDGRPLSRRWWSVAWLGIVGTIVGSLGLALAPGPLENFGPVPNPFGLESFAVGTEIAAIVGQLVYGTAIILSAASLIARFRRSRGEERQQLKWIAASGLFLALTLFSSFPLQLLAAASPATPATVPFGVALLVIAGFSSLPVATGIAILKHRLLDIDVVIRKTVLYASVAGFIVVAYTLMAVLLGGLLGRTRTAAIIAAGLIGLSLAPITRAARRFANKVVYGNRATPYEVLSEFSERVGGAYSDEEVLSTMARVLGEGSGATATQVWLRVGQELRPTASWPEGVSAPAIRLVGDELPAIEGVSQAVAVRDRGELLGALTVTKPPNDPLTQMEAQLVEDLSAQAGLVLRNVGLIEELRASRQRLVAAQDEERRRIERNIHDGAQQQLVALAVKLRLAEQLADRDVAQTKDTLAQLQSEAGDALENLRNLARGIYPPLLADKGLSAALEAEARKSPVPVKVEAEGTGRYPREIESAVYFCVLEALQNVAKYAKATRAVVRLVADGDRFSFEVSDDGMGFDPSASGLGTGLQGISDRLDAIGGSFEIRSAPGEGTTVIGRVPAQPAVAAVQAASSRSGPKADLGM